MTRDELTQKLTEQVKRFKGDTDGTWYELGQHAYMTAEFSNIGQATMFAQDVIWDFQVIATVNGGLWDDLTVPAQVNIRRYM